MAPHRHSNSLITAELTEAQKEQIAISYLTKELSNKGKIDNYLARNVNKNCSDEILNDSTNASCVRLNDAEYNNQPRIRKELPTTVPAIEKFYMRHFPEVLINSILR